MNKAKKGLKIIYDRAESMMGDIVQVYLSAVTFVLNDRGYGADGIERFAAAVNEYIADYCKDANAVVMAPDGTKRRNGRKYANDRMMKRVHEIMGDKLIYIELSDLVSLFRGVF